MAAAKKSGWPKTLSIVIGDPATELPFETAELRKQLVLFFDHKVTYLDANTKQQVERSVGSFQAGIYAFFDYDGEPIYVGQTTEKISTRVRRHLTNQRTDSVAMSVLDPYEVCKIKVWLTPEYEGAATKSVAGKRALNALEHAVFTKLLEESTFKAVLNEKVPPEVVGVKVLIPKLTHELPVVSEAVLALRDHPDLRLARRAATLARLAKVISERKVPRGLRSVLHTQATRLERLAGERREATKKLADPCEDGDD